MQNKPIPFLIQLAYLQINGGLNIYMIGEKHDDVVDDDDDDTLNEFVNLLCSTENSGLYVEQFEFSRERFKASGNKSFMYRLIMHGACMRTTWLCSRSEFWDEEFKFSSMHDFYTTAAFSSQVFEIHIFKKLLRLGFDLPKVARYMRSRGNLIVKTLIDNYPRIDQRLHNTIQEQEDIDDDDYEYDLMAYTPILEIGFIVLFDFKCTMNIVDKHSIVVTGAVHTTNLLRCFELLDRKHLLHICYKFSKFKQNITFSDLETFLTTCTQCRILRDLE